MSETQEEIPKRKRGRPRLTPEQREIRRQEGYKKYKYGVHNPAPPTKAERRLTAKQERFLRELISQDGHITQAEAAINAGYSPKSAASEASKLLNPYINPHVYRKYMEYKDEMEKKYAVNYKRHIRDLQIIRDKAMESGSWSAAVQAEYRRGQAHGDIYINKSEVRHGSIDQMSKEEVLKALQELRGGPRETFDAPEEGEEVSGVEFLGRIQEDDEEELSGSYLDEDRILGKPGSS